MQFCRVAWPPSEAVFPRALLRARSASSARLAPNPAVGNVARIGFWRHCTPHLRGNRQTGGGQAGSRRGADESPTQFLAHVLRSVFASRPSGGVSVGLSLSLVCCSWRGAAAAAVAQTRFHSERVLRFPPVLASGKTCVQCPLFYCLVLFCVPLVMK